MSASEKETLWKMSAALGALTAFFFLVRQYDRAWFPVLPAALAAWLCGSLLRARCFRAIREPAMAGSFVLAALASWAPGVLLGAGFTGMLACLVLSDGKRVGASTARKALFGVLSVSAGCSGIAMLGHGEALLAVSMAAWVAFLCLQIVPSEKGLATGFFLGWMIGFGMMAAELLNAPGTIDVFWAGVWTIGVAGSAVVGTLGSQYVMKCLGIRQSGWFLDLALCATMSAPGAAALLAVMPVFVV